MKSLQDSINESLLNESVGYIIYMPCSDPGEMEDIYWSIIDEFGDDSNMARDSWGFGDDYVKCYVYAKSPSQVKKFAKVHGAKFEKQ
jgi:hypothetical protein